MPDSAIATAADYSEALGVARRAKSLLALLILVMLVAQIATFLLIRYNIVPVNAPADSITVTAPAATQPTDRWADVMHYLTGVTILGGISLSIVLAATLLLIDHIMLVGRLIGVGKVTSAFLWTLILIVFLFPWQAFMGNAGLVHADWRIPGVLWTWDEMIPRVHFVSTLAGGQWAETILSWFRFVGAPAVAGIIVLAIQLKSNRGLRMALGEDELLNEMMRNS